MIQEGIGCVRMQRNIDGLILDVDGTLWDSTEIVAKAWTKAALEYGCHHTAITAERLKGLFGRTMEDIGKNLFPEYPEDKRKEILNQCCLYEHQALEEDECQICYPDVIQTIQKLAAKVPIFIVSNCQSGYIELFLKKTGLTSFVKDIECFGNTGKTKGENIRLVVERNRLRSAVYVGDTQGDCDAAGEAGIPFIHVSYGFGRVHNSDREINYFVELTEFI